MPLPQALLAWKVPMRQRNSETKPLRPGRPTLAMVKKTRKVAQMGILLARPPISRMLRVW